MRSAPRPDRRRAAFTLIELLAVVAILALVAGFVAPNLDVVKQRQLKQDAIQLAAMLELARQRTVMTGVPHRLFLDIDDGSYQLEWLARAPQAEPVPGENGLLTWPEPEYDLRGNSPLPLAAPPSEESFEPVPGQFGEVVFLDDALDFSGLETPEGWLTEGQTFVGFDRDGTASPSRIVLTDGEGNEMVLAIEALADSVDVWDPAQ